MHQTKSENSSTPVVTPNSASATSAQAPVSTIASAQDQASALVPGLGPGPATDATLGQDSAQDSAQTQPQAPSPNQTQDAQNAKVAQAKAQNAQAQSAPAQTQPASANQAQAQNHAQVKVDEAWDDEDEWAQPEISGPELQRLVAKVAQEQLSRSRGQRILPLFVVVLALFAAGVGMLQGAMLSKNITDVAQLQAQMKLMSGKLSDWGPFGCAVWYALSSLAGSLAILIPLMVYYQIGRKNAQSQHVGLAIYDFLRAEVLKYGLIVVILGCCLKFTDLRPAVMLISFAIMTILELILRLWALPKPENLDQYWHRSK